MWGNDSDSEYKKGYVELMAHAKDFNCFQLQELEDMVDTNIAASPIANSPYVKGVKEGLYVLRAKLGMVEATEIASRMKRFDSNPIVLETVEKNSHITKLIEQCNLLWKRQKL